MKSHVVLLMLVVGGIPGICASFQNLGFDEANTNQFVVDSYGLASDMLPGWQLSNGIPGPNLVGYNAFTIGLNYASLYDGEGKYSLSLYPGSDDNGNVAAYHLSQTGDVPVDARTIRFIDSGKPFELRVNGELLPLIYEYPPGYFPDRFVSPDPGLFPVLGDISAFAGQTVGLEFITLGGRSPVDYVVNGIDSISFSPESIPEPSTWALLALGGTCLLFRWRFLRSSVTVRRE